MVKIPTLFGKRLKAARISAKLTQRKLGLAAGMDIENAGVKINHYENRTHIPRPEVAVKIAQALNVPVSYLYEPNETIASIILNSGKLNSRKQKTLEEYSKTLAEKATSGSEN